MGQDDCLKFLKRKNNKDSWFTVKQISKKIGIGVSSCATNLSTLEKSGDVVKYESWDLGKRLVFYKYKTDKNKFLKKHIEEFKKRELKLKDDEWNEKIKNRDECCVVCGTEKFLNAHHIIPRENFSLRWDEDNGVTLCSKHHKFCNQISAHKNPFIFLNFLWSIRPEQLGRLKLKEEELRLLPTVKLAVR